MNDIRAIVFDLDDTLYLEQDFVLSGFRAVADWAGENLGIEATQGYIDLSNLYHQGIRNNTFDLWLSSYQIEGTNITASLIEIYRNHTPQICPFPETLSLLHQLAPQYKIGLVSDGYLSVQQRKWSALKLNDFFDGVVFSDQLGRENWKPSVAPFQIVLEKLDIPATSSVYVGDNPKKDFLGARQLGMYTIQVKHPQSQYSHIDPPTPDFAPDCKINSLLEIFDILNGLNSHNV
jgi:putative hydrolase of the HAD superfamily